MHDALRRQRISMPYTRELIRLFRSNGVPTQGLLSLGLYDLWNSSFKTAAHTKVESLKKIFAK